MASVFNLIFSFFLIVFLLFLRFLAITPAVNTTLRRKKKLPVKPHLLIVLGSGGHTAEIFRLLAKIDFRKYPRRTYVVTSGDAFSARKAQEFEDACPRGGKKEYIIKEIPRARLVGQSWRSTPSTAQACLRSCFDILAGLERPGWGMPDLILFNGPGSAVIVALACLIYKFLGLSSTRMIYVESFARVSTLSLSGRILYPFVDRFIVQWPELAQTFARAEYHGILV